MKLFHILAILISLSAVFSFINYRFLKLPAAIGLMLIAISWYRQFGELFNRRFLDEIVARADGVPLFAEELARSVADSGMLVESAGRYEFRGRISDLSIPSTLQGSLMGSNNFTIDVPHLCDLYLGGRLKLDEMVSRTISLDETGRARFDLDVKWESDE